MENENIKTLNFGVKGSRAEKDLATMKYDKKKAKVVKTKNQSATQEGVAEELRFRNQGQLDFWGFKYIHSVNTVYVQRQLCNP
jgi:hypothetical protein